VHSDRIHRYETPRQGVLALDNLSHISLNQHCNFEQALKNLEDFDRIWVIYLFHLNNNWNPMVTPPRHTRKKVGVFASRSPHRPNQIGISCVKLEKVDKLNIFISESDILDGSPVLDIKPYLPYADSFPNAATGWVKEGLENIYEVEFEPKAKEQCAWLKENSQINLVNFTRLQLEFNPKDVARKRITAAGVGELNTEKFVLAYRTWRILYIISEEEKKVIIIDINSGYTEQELNSPDDKYEDKPLHKLFLQKFSPV
jgi:tRNA-Thr(GGU) m(6)t(6)A37 methyltransferase TsaA